MTYYNNIKILFRVNMTKEQSSNTTWHQATVTRERREKANNHKSVILWFTGYSGAGKSTLAHSVEEKLHQLGCKTYVLDGDNIRHGLCGDLSFSDDDRKENIRRIGQVSKLFLESGVIVLSAFISPFKSDRQTVRNMVQHGDFIEIFCDSSIEVCEQRDIKGLYKKARDGEIKEFTGISSPYEKPTNPELISQTGIESLEKCTEDIIKLLEERNIFKYK